MVCGQAVAAPCPWSPHCIARNEHKTSLPALHGSYLPCFLWKIKLVQNLCVCVCNQVNLYIVFVLLSSACHFVNVTWFFSFGCRERLRCHSIVIILLHMFYVLFWLHKKTWQEQANGDTNCPSYICHQKKIKEEYLTVCCRLLPTCYFIDHLHMHF